MEHSERAHNEFGGSSASRNYNCKGSIALKVLKNIPDGESSDAAKEGTKFHELLDVCGQIIADYYNKKGKLPKLDLVMDFPLKDNWPDSMQRHARIWFDNIYREIKERKPKKLFPELVVEYPEPLEAAGRDWRMGGPADFLFGYQDDEGFHIFVADAKYGVGYVDEQSLQLLFYGCCAAAQFSKRKYKSVTVAVYQPRSETGEAEEPWRMHTYSEKQVYEWIDEFLLSAQTSVSLLGKGDEKIHEHLNAGEWCGFCECKHVCPSWSEMANEDAVIDFKDLETTIIEHGITEPERVANTLIPMLDTPEKIARFLHFSPFLKKIISHVQDLAITMMLEGEEEIPGWKIVEGRSQRKFKKDEMVQVIEGLKALGIQDPYEKKLRGIGSIETELKGLGMKAKEAKAAIEPLVTKSEPKKTLAPESDIREALQLEDVALSDFEGIDI